MIVHGNSALLKDLCNGDIKDELMQTDVDDNKVKEDFDFEKHRTNYNLDVLDSSSKSIENI